MTKLQEPRAKNPRRWNMPARYFTIDRELEDEQGTLKLIFIDTSPFVKEYHEEEKYRNVRGQDTAAQFRWLDSVLTQSRATWNIVIGHHPFYTGGKRRDDHSDNRERLEPLFNKHNVVAYFCGHKHDLQHLKPKGPTHYFVSGAGSEIRPTGSIGITKFSASVNGFMLVSLTHTTMMVQAIDYRGAVLYETNIGETDIE